MMMHVEPVELVVTAVALGASAGLKDTAEAVVKDSYATLKRLLGRRGVDVSGIERRPDSDAQKDALAEDIVDTCSVVDEELLDAASELIDVVAEHDSESATAIGVDLRDVRAEFLKIRSVGASGSGVRVVGGDFTGGIDIENVEAGIIDGSKSPRSVGHHGPNPPMR